MRAPSVQLDSRLRATVSPSDFCFRKNTRSLLKRIEKGLEELQEEDAVKVEELQEEDAVKEQCRCNPTEQERTGQTQFLLSTLGT